MNGWECLALMFAALVAYAIVDAVAEMVRGYRRTPFRSTVWLIAKPGDEVCATARPISEERSDALRAQGYDVFRAEVELPARYAVGERVGARIP